MDSEANEAQHLIANILERRLSEMYPMYFQQTNNKHNFYEDYGYPKHLTFKHFYSMYKRDGLGRGLVNKRIEKVWQDDPWLLEDDDVHDETTTEKAIARKLKRLGFWNKLSDAETYELVGGHSGILLRFNDGKAFREPVGVLTGGLTSLLEIIPVYGNQLRVTQWNTDTDSPDYGAPLMYQYTEMELGEGESQREAGAPTTTRDVHPDRVFIWSKTGKPWGESFLEAPYNDLIDLEKIRGAGGEGFWRNAKNAPVFSMDKDAHLQKLARSLGVPEDKVGDKISEMVQRYNKGFDDFLMMQGIDAQHIPVSLPDPEKFALVSTQAACTACSVPLKVQMGSQSGERASTEDSREWNQTCNSHRARRTIPNINRFVEHLTRVGIFAKGNDLHVGWSDLTESTTEEKVETSGKMATANQNNRASGEIFTVDEIRDQAGLAPLADVIGKDKANANTGEDDDLEDFDENGEPVNNG